jgi:polysaccharide biosynthesis transport protein
VSRNFELLRRTGKDLNRLQPGEPFSTNPYGGRVRHDVPGHAARESIIAREQTLLKGGLPSPSVAEEEVTNWLKKIGILQKHWRLSALLAFVIMLSVTAVTYWMRPLYEAQGRIEIDPPGEVFSLDGGVPISSDREVLQTQVELLQSDSLALAVIRKLHLDRNENVVGRIKPETIGAATPVSDALQPSLRENIALEKFRDLLKITHDPSSRLVSVNFRSHDPQLAALVSNTLVQSFIDQSFNTRHDAIMKSSEWISRELDDIRTKMEDSARALAQFQESTGVVDDGNQNTFTEHMGELTRQLTQAEAERIQLQALLKSVQTGSPDSLPESRNNPVVQKLSEELAEKRAELSQTLVVYGKNHPTAKKLQSQIDELQSQLNKVESAILSSLRANAAAAEAREHMMADEMKGTTKELDQMARYNDLKKNLQTNQDLYNALNLKIKEAGISAASKSATIRVVDQAEVPKRPIRPNWALNLSTGLVVALLGGVVLAFVLELFDNRLRSPEDIRRWIGSSNVSVIPAIGESDRKDARLALPKRIVGVLPSASMAEEARKNMFMLERPHSPEAEALQGLYGSLMLAGHENPPQVVLIASAFPGEGKTTVALNLSLAFAKHANTCLVDADLRKGRIAKAFGLFANEGLCDVLTEARSLESVLLEPPGRGNLSIVSAGRSDHNSGQLICSETMRQVLQELRQRFRFVVIDSPPILPFVDGRALSAMADAVVLVGRAGITTRGAMQRCIDLLSEIHAGSILHVVLNGADMNSIDYQYYRYGYDNYEVGTSK